MIGLEPRPGSVRERSGSAELISPRTALVALLLAAAVVVALTLRPFAGALFMGAVLAATFHPWHERLSAHLGGRRTTGAVLLSALLVLAIVIPVVTLGVIAMRESMDALDWIRQTLGAEGPEGLIARLPGPLKAPAQALWLQLPPRERQAQFMMLLETRAAQTLPGLAGSVWQMLLQSALTIIAAFFLLVDGGRLVTWLDRVSPLRERHTRELYVEFRKVSTTVLLGSVVTAGAQSLVAMGGYLLAHVPNPFFLTLATFFVGLIPMVGAGTFSFLVAIYVYLSGHPYAALFLAAYSVGIVGIVDNVLKPVLIKGGIEMHGGVVFFALLGGFAAFGLVGLVLGPMSVALLIALLRIYRRDGTNEATA